MLLLHEGRIYKREGESKMIDLHGKLIRVRLDNNKSFEYDWTALNRFWRYADEETVEHISAKMIDDQLCVVLTAEKGQTGIVSVIDTKTNRVTAWFESPFALCATINENIIYSLNSVSRWGTEPYNYITVYNTDTNNKEIVDIPYEDYGENASLEFVEGKLTIIRNSK